MKTKKVIIAMLIVIGVLLVWVTPALAVPPLPSSFWGLVLVDNDNVPLGTTVSAWINGVKYAEAPVFMYDGDTVYSLDVPGDDSSTPGIEGGVEGEEIHFQIKISDTNIIEVQETRPWQSGKNVGFAMNVNGATAIRLTNLKAFSDDHKASSKVLWVGMVVLLTMLGWTWWRKARQGKRYQ